MPVWLAAESLAQIPADKVKVKGAGRLTRSLGRMRAAKRGSGETLLGISVVIHITGFFA
jgi:hypothetical protein